MEIEAFYAKFDGLLGAPILLLFVNQVIRIFEIWIDVVFRLSYQPGKIGPWGLAVRALRVLVFEGLLSHPELGYSLEVVKFYELLSFFVRNLPNQTARPRDCWNCLVVSWLVFVKQAIDQLWTAFRLLKLVWNVSLPLILLFGRPWHNHQVASGISFELILVNKVVMTGGSVNRDSRFALKNLI